MDYISENLVNNTTNGTEYLPYSKRIETYLAPAVFATIYIVGILGNGTIIITFLKNQSMRNIPNTYIFSLAFGDLLVIFFCVPMATVVYTYDKWPFGLALCRSSEFAKEVSIGVSVFTLTALASDRYYAIVNPLKKLQTRSKNVVIIIGIIWIMAILCALPSAIVSEVVTSNGFTFCSPFGDHGKTYKKYVTITKAAIYYFLPLTIIGILYTLMAKELHSSARQVQTIGGSRLKNPQAQNRRHVARMVIVFILVFIFCFLPHWIFQLWFWCVEDAEYNYDIFWHVIRMCGFGLS
ncbi:unnamed protein product [Diamesa hyperborea]